jgi:hypothetical protein
MGTDQEFMTEFLQACQEYQKNLTTEPPEWLKPYLSVGEVKTSLQDESLTEPQVNFLDAHDEGVLALKHNEDLVLDDFPLDVDLTSRELCMRDDEEEVGKLTHELHMELSLAHSSSFQSSMVVEDT